MSTKIRNIHEFRDSLDTLIRLEYSRPSNNLAAANAKRLAELNKMEEEVNAPRSIVDGFHLREATLYEELMMAGVEIDHHESDLYFPRTDAKAMEVLKRHPRCHDVASTFVSDREDGGRLWIEVPLAYQPYWWSRESRPQIIWAIRAKTGTGKEIVTMSYRGFDAETGIKRAKKEAREFEMHDLYDFRAVPS